VSLASKFIESGAIGYIGALWRVSDEVSDLIGELFYDYLMLLPFGAALKMIKELCFQLFPEDYTSLAFILSGDPTIHFYDPFYKSIDAFYYLRVLEENFNRGRFKKALEYYQRTKYAFEVFENELEERKCINPNYKTLFTYRILNFKALLAFLAGNIKILETSINLINAFMEGNFNLYKTVGESILDIAKIIRDASNIALDSGNRLTYRMHYEYLRMYGTLQLAIYEYFNENFNEALKQIDKFTELWDKSGKKLDNLWEKYDDGFTPIDLIDDQHIFIGLVGVGWKCFIEGIEEYHGSVNMFIILNRFDTAIKYFQMNLDFRDISSKKLLDYYTMLLYNEFGIIFLLSRNFNKTQKIFEDLISICESCIIKLNSLLNLDFTGFKDEINKLNKEKDLFQSFIDVSRGFLHWNTFNKNKKIDDKNTAIKHIEKAIKNTPNKYFKNKWEKLLNVI